MITQTDEIHKLTDIASYINIQLGWDIFQKYNMKIQKHIYDFRENSTRKILKFKILENTNHASHGKHKAGRKADPPVSQNLL